MNLNLAWKFLNHFVDLLRLRNDAAEILIPLNNSFTKRLWRRYLSVLIFSTLHVSFGRVKANGAIGWPLKKRQNKRGERMQRAEEIGGSLRTRELRNYFKLRHLRGPMPKVSLQSLIVNCPVYSHSRNDEQVTTRRRLSPTSRYFCHLLRHNGVSGQNSAAVASCNKPAATTPSSSACVYLSFRTLLLPRSLCKLPGEWWKTSKEENPFGNLLLPKNYFSLLLSRNLGSFSTGREDKTHKVGIACPWNLVSRSEKKGNLLYLRLSSKRFALWPPQLFFS